MDRRPGGNERGPGRLIDYRDGRKLRYVSNKVNHFDRGISSRLETQSGIAQMKSPTMAAGEQESELRSYF